MDPEMVLVPTERRVIAFDGPSGAGKTTLAHRLAAALGGAGQVVVLSLDQLYPGWDGLEGGVRRLVEHVLVPYAGGAVELEYPTWNWADDGPGPVHSITAPALLIVEGVGAGAQRAARYLDLLIWVDAPEPIRRLRALQRDGETYRPHWVAWARSEHAHFHRECTRERAEIHLGLP